MAILLYLPSVQFSSMMAAVVLMECTSGPLPELTVLAAVTNVVTGPYTGLQQQMLLMRKRAGTYETMY